jgi:putative endonuclease
MTDSRKELGNAGERTAEKHLVSRGYSILARNFRSRQGELDLIARKDGVIVFAEVKTRNNGQFESAAESITETKKQKLELMAETFLQDYSEEYESCRFDALIVLPGDGKKTRIEHIENII